MLVHRPDLSLKRLTPSNAADLLFDDVLWVRKAGEQHDDFVDLLRERGVEVLLLGELLTDTCQNPLNSGRQIETGQVAQPIFWQGATPRLR